jgi:hypothetical protein
MYRCCANERLPARWLAAVAALIGVAGLCGCVGGNGQSATAPVAPPINNTLALTVDAGPAGGGGGINHAYVTVKVCAHGTSQCANIDHVLLDTASVGLRLVGSVLAAASVKLTDEVDSGNHTIEECATFGGGQTWGPVASADVSMAGESAAGVPLQIMDDQMVTAPPPASCGANGTLINSVAGFDANGVLGVGVFAQDCGNSCVAASPAVAMYYGCTSGGSGVCTAENVALMQQVTNPVWLLSSVDNNGIIVELPNLQNPNGDVSVQGKLLFGLATQADNALPPSGLTVLGTDASGHFTANYKGNVLPSLIDSGSDAYEFDDASIPSCSGATFVGYYCPTPAPLPLSAVNAGVGANSGTDTVQFALANPDNTFIPTAAAFSDLGGGGGSTEFIWGMPYFYGRTIYVGLESRLAGPYTGPFFAY